MSRAANAPERLHSLLEDEQVEERKTAIAASLDLLQQAPLFKEDRKTRFYRVTLSQEARVVLRTAVYCEVQILVPEAPVVFADIDVLPMDFGPNRTYKAPTLPPNAQIEFRMAEGQHLVMAAKEAFVTCTLIVQPGSPPLYHEPF